MRLTGDIAPKSEWVVGFFTTIVLEIGVSSGLTGIMGAGATDWSSVRHFFRWFLSSTVEPNSTNQTEAISAAMKFSWSELFGRLTGEEPTDEEKQRIEEAMGDALEALSFEDVASSVKEDYPNATEEDLRRAITMKEDGYEISYGKLPPQPFKEKLEDWEEAGIEEVQILSERSEETCEICWEADGKTFTTKEALQKMPLPHNACRCEPTDWREGGDCACTYLPKN